MKDDFFIFSGKSKIKNAKHNYTKNIHDSNFFTRVHVTFVKGNGERIKASAKVGDTLLDVVVNNDLDLDGYGEFDLNEVFLILH